MELASEWRSQAAKGHEMCQWTNKSIKNQTRNDNWKIRPEGVAGIDYWKTACPVLTIFTAVEDRPDSLERIQAGEMSLTTCRIVHAFVSGALCCHVFHKWWGLHVGAQATCRRSIQNTGFGTTSCTFQRWNQRYTSCRVSFASHRPGLLSISWFYHSKSLNIA